MKRLRWRLARWIAPEPIMADPCPGRESFVVQRSKPGESPSFQLSVPLDTLDIEIKHEPDNTFGRDSEVTYFNRWRRITLVTGTAES